MLASQVSPYWVDLKDLVKTLKIIVELKSSSKPWIPALVIRCPCVCVWECRVKSKNFIFQYAQTLVTNLAVYRQGNESLRNPIIWIAHSFGGILLKRALLYSNDVNDVNQEHLRSIYISTYGIIFLGTPHTGSGLAAWGRVLQAMSDAVVPRRLFNTEPILLKTLKRDSEQLQEINSRFLHIYERFRIHMVHENHKTSMLLTRQVLRSCCFFVPFRHRRWYA